MGKPTNTMHSSRKHKLISFLCLRTEPKRWTCVEKKLIIYVYEKQSFNRTFELHRSTMILVFRKRRSETGIRAVEKRRVHMM